MKVNEPKKGSMEERVLNRLRTAGPRGAGEVDSRQFLGEVDPELYNAFRRRLSRCIGRLRRRGFEIQLITVGADVTMYQLLPTEHK